MAEAPSKHTESHRPAGIEILGAMTPVRAEILAEDALALIARLHRKFDSRRRELLDCRRQRAAELRAGQLPDFLSETEGLRAGDWRVAPVPADLRDRRVEITGPVDRKMIINALNAPVKTFMADFEDSCSPTWGNLVDGQANLRDAVRRTIDFTAPETGRHYRLNANTAVLIVRPRGLHLEERHVTIDGRPVAGAFFDFGLFLFHNARALVARGSGPYFYLPKLESHLEARLWSEVIVAAEEAIGLAPGTVKVTVLIETILAAFEMDEILHELRRHIVGLNCGRWDYIFSFIKKLGFQRQFVLPDRSVVTMDQHFLKSYVDLLIRTCHRRGAHAMGGMAAQIPIKDDPVANERAIAKVREDKTREARAGHDGTWIAHPGLAPVAMQAFDAVMRGPNQLDVLRPEVSVSAADLLRVPPGDITEQGLRHNIRVGVQYLEAWLGGNGCVPLYGLMEDAATAEICRAQSWQWLRHRVRLSDGRELTPALFSNTLGEERERIRGEIGDERYTHGKFGLAEQLFAEMVQKSELDEFLTLPAYQYLNGD